MSAAREQQALNEDGTPRRKYELEEQEESKIGLRAAVGLVLANGFILLKNALLGDEADASPSAGVPERKPGKVGQDQTAYANSAVAETGKASSTEEESEAVGSGFSLSLFSTREPYYPDHSEPIEFEVVLSRLPPMPVNDNEVLYGATPGAGIDLSGGAGSPPPSGSGGGGSAPPSHGTPNEEPGGNHDNDDDSDDDDDDDDDESQNQSPRTNRLPVVTAPVVLADLVSNHSIVIALSELLQHASDPDGDTLIVRNLASSSGTLVARSDGSWLFTPETDDISEVTFTYAISDGQGEVSQTALLDLVPPEVSRVIGTSGSDTLIGTPEADIIDALEGDDLILGREGDDVITAGDGNDRVIAGDGDDVVYAGKGDDVVFAGAGNDTVFGGDGDDVLFGEEGDDRLFGEAGNDTISGGPGADVIAGGDGDNRLFGNEGDDVIEAGEGHDEIEGGDGDDVIVSGGGNDIVAGNAGDDFIAGGEGDDTLCGNEGNDELLGGGGNDEIDGGAGNDTITAGAGDDTAFGGEGDDVFVATAGDGNDAYDGGDGCDLYDLSATTADAVIDLQQGTATSDEIGTDTLTGIEAVVGGSGNDTLIAGDEVNSFTGGAGDDVFIFRTAKAAGKGKGGRDKILDFEVGDRIDLDDISEEFADEFEDTFEDQGIRRFILIGQQEEFTKPGQMRFKYDTIDEKEVTIVQGNIDYDPEADFEIELIGRHELKHSDFYGNT